MPRGNKILCVKSGSRQMLNMTTMLTNAQKSSYPEPMGSFHKAWYMYVASGTLAHHSLYK